MAGIRDRLAEFLTFDTEVLAISCDPVYSLRAFADQDGLNFPLLSDFWPHGEVSRAYDVFDEAKGCPRRSSYVVDKDGVGPLGGAQRHARGPRPRRAPGPAAESAGLDQASDELFGNGRQRLGAPVYISAVEPLVTRDASGSTHFISAPGCAAAGPARVVCARISAGV